MSYLVETAKSFEQAAADLESAVKRHGFRLLHVYDLAMTLRSKGIAYEEQCKIFEVGFPGLAMEVLPSKSCLNLVSPCRISVFTDKMKTKISLNLQAQMLSALFHDTILIQTAKAFEERTIQIINEAK